MPGISAGVRKLFLPLLAALVASAGFAAPSYAVVENWFFGKLNNNTGNEGGPRHSIYYIEGKTNHNNFCVAGDTRGPGFYYVGSSGLLTALPQACSSSGGFASISYSASCCQYGFIQNRNAFSISVYSQTHYSW